MEKKTKLSDELQLGKAGEHLVCFDLILQGYNAFLADQGLPYDVLVDISGTLYKIQVKTTEKLVTRGQSKNVYRISIKRGRRVKFVTKNTPIEPNVDVYAFVATDIRKVAYLPVSQVLGESGNILQTLEFKTRRLSYRTRRGKYFEDYEKFRF